MIDLSRRVVTYRLLMYMGILSLHTINEGSRYDRGITYKAGFYRKTHSRCNPCMALQMKYVKPEDTH